MRSQALPCRYLVLVTLAFAVGSYGQDDGGLLAADDFVIDTALLEDPTATIAGYEHYSALLGGDSVRHCNGFPCIGWVEDHHPAGALKHRGYYDAGRLVLYKNYHADGTLERDFKALDNVRCVLRTYHANGALSSETRYVDGVALSYEDHYRNGQLRYEEQKHRSGAYYERMNIHAPDGKPISTMELVDRKRSEFLLREYHPNGRLRSEGRARYNAQRMDTQRVGSWAYFDTEGRSAGGEEYVDGKVHASTTSPQDMGSAK